MEEPDQKMPPLEDIPTVLITSPPKSPPKSKGSMTMEVSNLLSQAVLEASSCESQQYSQGGQPQQWSSCLCHRGQRGLPPPANTSSQVSIDEGEASLEDMPANISPIAVVSGSDSTSTLIDLAEL